MRLAMRSLLIAALAALAAPSAMPRAEASAKARAEPSIIVAFTKEVRPRYDLRPVFANEPPGSFFIGGVYEADFRILRQLGGPPMPRNARILFLGDEGRANMVTPRMFMVVRVDDEGRYWAGQAWQEVYETLCLSLSDIESLQIKAAFADGRNSDEGKRCMKI